MCGEAGDGLVAYETHLGAGGEAMDCRNPNCDGKLGWKDGKCKKCGTWRQAPINRLGESKPEQFPEIKNSRSKHQVYGWKDSKVLRELYIEMQQGNKTLKDIHLVICAVFAFAILGGLVVLFSLAQ